MKAGIHFLYRFLSEGLPLLLSVLPIYILLRWQTLFPMERTRRIHRRIDWYRESLLLLLFSYLVLLFVQTFLIPGDENLIELIPFKVIVVQVIESFQSSEGYEAFLFNILGNIAVFVPIGYLVSKLNGGDFQRTVITGFGISLFIEVMQIPLMRTTDVDDLILNTTGAVIGFYCSQFWTYLHEQQHKQ